MTTYTLRPAGSDDLTPADYRDIFTELRANRSLRRLVEAAGAAEGWGYRPVEFDDPITAHIVRQMGWRELCASEEPHTDRARFCDAYARIAQRERQQASLPAALQDGALSHRQLTPGDRDPQALVRQIAGAMSANSRS